MTILETLQQGEMPPVPVYIETGELMKMALVAIFTAFAVLAMKKLIRV